MSLMDATVVKRTIIEAKKFKIALSSRISRQLYNKNASIDHKILQTVFSDLMTDIRTHSLRVTLPIHTDVRHRFLTISYINSIEDANRSEDEKSLI